MSNLKRYDFDEQWNEGEGVIESDEGEYVKFDDIKELLKQSRVTGIERIEV